VTKVTAFVFCFQYWFWFESLLYNCCSTYLWHCIIAIIAGASHYWWWQSFTDFWSAL